MSLPSKAAGIAFFWIGVDDLNPIDSHASQICEWTPSEAKVAGMSSSSWSAATELGCLSSAWAGFGFEVAEELDAILSSGLCDRGLLLPDCDDEECTDVGILGRT